MENPLLWLTTHHTWSSPKGNVLFPSSQLRGRSFLSLTLTLVAAMIIWAMTTMDEALTAARAMTASQNIPTCPWSPTRRVGAQSVARWSRGLRSSMLRRYKTDLDWMSNKCFFLKKLVRLFYYNEFFISLPLYLKATKGSHAKLRVTKPWVLKCDL